jgi:hypothetical protein
MKRTRHTPEQVINKLRETDAMRSSGRSMAQVLQHLGVSEQTFLRLRNQYGGMKSEEAKRLKNQLLWLHRFRTFEELNQALRDFARRFNSHWIIGRIGYRTPAAHRSILLGPAA